jgi:hypothetical protein
MQSQNNMFVKGVGVRVTKVKYLRQVQFGTLCCNTVPPVPRISAVGGMIPGSEIDLNTIGDA